MNRTEFLKDTLPGLFFLVIGVVILTETNRMNDSFSIGVGMDARAYPRVLSLGCIAVSLLLLVKGVLGPGAAAPGLSPAQAPDAEVAGGSSGFPVARVIAALASYAAYTAMLPHLGFLVATSLLVASQLVIAGERRIWPICALSVLFSVVVFHLVRVSFSIVLPEGIFGTY